VVIAIIPIVLPGVFIARGIHHRNEYKEFLIDFDTSISFALQKDTLKAENGSTATFITAKNAKSIFNMIFDGGFYYYDEEIPESEKVIYLDFGSGDKIWISADDDKAKTTNLLIRYIKVDGEEYTYMTKEAFNFGNLERLVSVQYGNALWSE